MIKLPKFIQIIRSNLTIKKIRYKIFRKNFIIPKTLNEELFLAIEGRNGYRLELVAENK